MRCTLADRLHDKDRVDWISFSFTNWKATATVRIFASTSRPSRSFSFFSSSARIWLGFAVSSPGGAIGVGQFQNARSVPAPSISGTANKQKASPGTACNRSVLTC